MLFDIIFLDTTSNKFYDRMTLEKQALGGSEASVIRIAEGLGSLGLKVAVIEARIDKYFEPIIGQHAFFFHSDDVANLQCKHYIQIRANTNPQLFPGSKKYVWCHDVATKDREGTWIEDINKYGIQLIGVSRWHRNNLKDATQLDNVVYIYNPVPDEIYVGHDAKTNYDPNIMVWLSSPHKGLDEAVKMFQEIRAENSKMQLIVFNPGYRKINIEALSVIPGISVYGAMSCKQVWNVVQKSLCVFYPTRYEETFGLVAAEANALGTPIATNPVAALKETVSGSLVESVKDTVLDWSKNGRPKVIGKDEFRLSNVLVEWCKLLAR